MKEAAESANELDRKMENLHKEINEIKKMDEDFSAALFTEENDFNIPLNFLKMISENNNMIPSKI